METRRTTQGRVLSAAEAEKKVIYAVKAFGEWYNASSKPNVIFACLGGSHSYGFATVESDFDIRGIWMANAEDFFTLNPPTPREAKSTIQRHGEDVDIELQELTKFLSLALKNNPNILESLFVPEKFIVVSSSIYQEMREAMPIILNKDFIFNAYRDYALQQFTRMRQQYTDFKIEQESVAVFSPEEYKAKLDELRTQHDRNDWDSLLQRKITIDVHRPVPMAERKLNIKNAAHLLRLLATAEYVLRTGEMRISPPNKEFIIEVRTGNVSWEEIISEKERLERATEKAYERSVLKGDYQAALSWANDFLKRVRKDQLT